MRNRFLFPKFTKRNRRYYISVHLSNVEEKEFLNVTRYWIWENNLIIESNTNEEYDLVYTNHYTELDKQGNWQQIVFPMSKIKMLSIVPYTK